MNGKLDLIGGRVRPMFLGAHMPVRGAVWTALKTGYEVGCEVVQLFLKNNRRWEGREFDAAEVEEFFRLWAGFGFKAVFAHAGYLINLAAVDPSVRLRSIRSLIFELRLAARLGLPFVVVHPGCHGGAGESLGLQRLIESLEVVLKETAGLKVSVGLETTAGQGSALGARLEHFEWIYSKCSDPRRLVVCLDTAHLFAAGYRIDTAEGWESFVGELDRRIGLNRVACIHLNDSASGAGSRVDKHAHIGRGLIGIEGFARIVNEPRFAHLPGCIETPKSKGLAADRRNLGVLRRLRVTL